jgi:hypothetical protein
MDIGSDCRKALTSQDKIEKVSSANFDAANIVFGWSKAESTILILNNWL